MYDQAIAAHRTFAFSIASGDVDLRALENRYLGKTYRPKGDHPWVVDCFSQTRASLEEARCHERFGQVYLPAVLSCVWLACCHAELGSFAEGCVFADKGLQIAEEVAYPGGRMNASWESVCWPAAKATYRGGFPSSNGPWTFVRRRTSRSRSPWWPRR